MAFFEWQHDFSVSVAEIDDQHRGLIRLINQLHDAIERTNEIATLESVLTELDAVSSVIDELIAYASNHFATEENYMREYGYPGYDHHREQHEQFTEQVRSFERSFQEKKTRLSIDIAEFIKNWWQTHILGPDKQCGTFLGQKGLC